MVFAARGEIKVGVEDGVDGPGVMVSVMIAADWVEVVAAGLGEIDLLWAELP